MNFFQALFKSIKNSKLEEAEQSKIQQPVNIYLELDRNLQYIKEIFGNSADLTIRRFQISGEQKTDAGIVYIEGMINREAVDRILGILMIDTHHPFLDLAGHEQKRSIEFFKERLLPVSGLKETDELQTVALSVLMGETIILVDGCPSALRVTGTQGWDKRSIDEPTTQTVVRGPREGFTEDITTNTTLIRRKIRNPNLWLESKQIGSVTQTNVAIMYIHGTVNEMVLQELRSRLNAIRLESVLESGYIEEMIQDHKFSLFPTIYNSERPDVIAAGLLEGQIAILVDGTPFVLLVPALFGQFFQSADDYYFPTDYGLLRLLRYFSIIAATLTPSLYIAITTFHQEMIPNPLLISVAAQREGVPFPAFVEALIMEVTFEILREAGIRMPKMIGQTISIVGALVLGQAAVEAGLVSATMVIIVSITAMTNLLIPSYNLARSIRYLRFIFMLLAASFGLLGIFAALIGVSLHLCHLKSFGVPFMYPLAPFQLGGQRDFFFRIPWWGKVTKKKWIQSELVLGEIEELDIHNNSSRNQRKKR